MYQRIRLKAIYNLETYFRAHLACYLVNLFFLLAGIVSGALTLRVLPGAQLQDLGQYLSGFLINYEEILDRQGLVLRQSLSQNLKYLVLIWFSGVTVIGFPLIFLFIFLKGFLLGFAVGFLVERLALKGILLAAAAILPQNLFILPAILIAGAGGLSQALLALKLKFRGRKMVTGEGLPSLGGQVLLTLLLIVMAGLVEAYITTVFLRYVLPVIN